LRGRTGLPEGVKGETWQVHGGGFYHIQKYLVAPGHMPEELTWFKWEAYSTWIFGFLLLASTYYAHPALYLIDPMVAAIEPWQAVVASLASLAVGWLLYDGICRSPLGRDARFLTIAVAVLVAAFSEFYLRLFGGRAAYLHVGALVGSLMVGNVFFLIIPNQKKVVAELIAGRQPAPHLGAQAKQRSTHNNYLTLPVLFLMISNHYPMTFGTGHARLVLAGLFITSFLVRHFFNMKHAGLTPYRWLWPAAALVMIGTITLTLPAPAAKTAGPVSLADVQTIVATRCVACHSATPTFEGIAQAPKGVMFDRPEQIAAHAAEIYQQVVVTKAMPLGNVTEITDQERAKIAAWAMDGTR